MLHLLAEVSGCHFHFLSVSADSGSVTLEVNVTERNANQPLKGGRRLGESRGRGNEEGRGFHNKALKTHTRAQASSEARPDVLAANRTEQEVPHCRLVVMVG